jgi:hypothetical protein
MSPLAHALGAGLPVRPHGSAAQRSARTLAAARSAMAGRATGWRHFAAFAGPAVVASIAYMDPDNFATNIQAGSRYGYDLLWVVLLANLVAMLFQALSAKLGIAMHAPAAAFRHRYAPGSAPASDPSAGRARAA